MRLIARSPRVHDLERRSAIALPDIGRVGALRVAAIIERPGRAAVRRRLKWREWIIGHCYGLIRRQCRTARIDPHCRLLGVRVSDHRRYAGGGGGTSPLSGHSDGGCQVVSTAWRSLRVSTMPIATAQTTVNAMTIAKGALTESLSPFVPMTNPTTIQPAPAIRIVQPSHLE